MIANIELTGQQELLLAGITVRTTNQNGQSQKDIGSLWQRFMAEGLAQQITTRLGDDDTYCVYTDYESDYMGYYTTLIGCRVSSFDDLPPELTTLTIPAAKYQVYTLTGKFPEKVHQAWQEIWNSDADRAYTVDFDLYSANAKSFEDTEVKIYLSVK